MDSILPIEEEIRRFNATIPEMPDALAGGAPSRDELVLRFVGAVEAADTAAFRDLVMTRSEFAALYYPHTRYLHPPFQLSPALVWFMQENRTSQGFARIARRLAGKRLHAEGYTCTEPPEIEERNRIWHDCRILLRPPGSDSATAVRLFGSILERDGIHKFVSYSNDF